MLVYYVNCYNFLEEPEKYWAKMLEEEKEGSPEPTLFFDKGDELLLKIIRNACLWALRIRFLCYFEF